MGIKSKNIINMLNFTPGPWRVREQPVESAGFYIERTDLSDKNSFIGEVGGGLQPLNIVKNNAKLIASAPEMYQLLLEIYRMEGLKDDTMGKINRLIIGFHH